jgi:hemin uptake protein HemP
MPDEEWTISKLVKRLLDFDDDTKVIISHDGTDYTIDVVDDDGVDKLIILTGTEA